MSGKSGQIPLQNNPIGLSTLRLSHRNREDINFRFPAPQTTQFHSTRPSHVQLQPSPKPSDTRYKSIRNFGWLGRQSAHIITPDILHEIVYTSSTPLPDLSSRYMKDWAEHTADNTGHTLYGLIGTATAFIGLSLEA